jgi:hypothetical protein
MYQPDADSKLLTDDNRLLLKKQYMQRWSEKLLDDLLYDEAYMAVKDEPLLKTYSDNIQTMFSYLFSQRTSSTSSTKKTSRDIFPRFSKPVFVLGESPYDQEDLKWLLCLTKT